MAQTLQTLQKVLSSVSRLKINNRYSISDDLHHALLKHFDH